MVKAQSARYGLLQVAGPQTIQKRQLKDRYRLAFIDSNKSSGYPANFICILPRKIYDTDKPLSLFAEKFGDDSVNYAVELLKEAIKQEKDRAAKLNYKKDSTLYHLTTFNFQN